MITEIGAVLSFSAATNNDKVGVIFFSDKVEGFIPPKKGRSHILRIIRELIALEPKSTGGTHLSSALDYLNNVLKKRTITFILSDFISAPYESPLQLAARRHDVVGIQVYDKADRELPRVGIIQVADAETGTLRWIDSNSKKVQLEYGHAFQGMKQYGVQSFRKCGATLLSVRTDEDYVKMLQGFFKGR
jgi:uncharacterized protein (DUF58 family)